MLDVPGYLMTVTVSWNSFLTPGVRSLHHQHQEIYSVFNCIALRLFETACLFTKSTQNLFGISFLIKPQMQSVSWESHLLSYWQATSLIHLYLDWGEALITNIRFIYCQISYIQDTMGNEMTATLCLSFS